MEKDVIFFFLFPNRSYQLSSEIVSLRFVSQTTCSKGEIIAETLSFILR